MLGWFNFFLRGIPRKSGRGLVVVAAAAHAQQAQHEQEDVDEVQVQRQRAVDAGLFGQGAVHRVVGVHLVQLLGIVGSQQHKDHQADAAVEQHRADAKAEQAAHQAGDQHGDQAHHQFGAPAGQVAVGGVAVERHQPEVDRRAQESHHQSAHREQQEVIAQHHAVQSRVGQEHAAGGAHRHLLDAGAEEEHQAQLGDGQQQVEGIDQVKQGCGRGQQSHAKGHGKAAGHPAVGPRHIIGCGHRRFGVAAVVIVVVVVHSDTPFSAGGGYDLLPRFDAYSIL